MSRPAVPSGPTLHEGATRMLSDDRLAGRAAKGDERALAAIYRRYHRSLFRFCLAIVGNRADAQDALQNTMVKVLRALPGEERRIELKPWLYRIAHNESIDLLRRRRETRELDPELATTGPGLTEETESRERLRRLISDIGELSERQRGAVVMRELGGLEFAEIGIALGTSPTVARQTLYEARLCLRDMDKGRGMACSTVTKALSDGDGRVIRRRDVRAHLRTCEGCRRFRDGIDARERDLAALSPLPAVAAAGLLQGLLGGGAAGGGLAALGGAAVSGAGGAAALKGAATVAVIAAIGVGAADRAGLIDAGLPSGNSQPTEPREGVRGTGELETEIGGSSDAGARTGGSPPALLGEGDRPGVAAAQGSARATGAGLKSSSAATTAASDDAVAPHPNGKQLPSASAHGQQTAAAHKAGGQGGGRQRGGVPAEPKPVRPSTPSAAKGGATAPGAAVREEHSRAPLAPATRAAEHPSPGPQPEKKNQHPPQVSPDAGPPPALKHQQGNGTP
jgi:RNA polymerase sigma factor (sigma-70 family)